MSAFKTFVYRLLGEPEQVGEMRELLELTTKAARRCTHDLGHCADDIWMYRNRGEEATAAAEDWHKRAEMWGVIFYPDRGPKNYRSEMHLEISRLECEVTRLRDLLRANLLADNDGDIPF